MRIVANNFKIDIVETRLSKVCLSCCRLRCCFILDAAPESGGVDRVIVTDRSLSELGSGDLRIGPAEFGDSASFCSRAAGETGSGSNIDSISVDVIIWFGWSRWNVAASLVVLAACARLLVRLVAIMVRNIELEIAKLK